jgi:hypothetical protein
VWSSPRGPLGSESSLVSQHSVSPSIYMIFMPMQSSPIPTPILEDGMSLGIVFSHPFQPTVEELVIPM